MKTAFTMMLAGVVASTMFAGAAAADDAKPRIYTRSVEAAHADLVRDWNFKGAGTPGVVRQRTKAEMQADLVRDWNGPSKAEVAADQHAVVNARSEQQAFDDLVRNWGG